MIQYGANGMTFDKYELFYDEKFPTTYRERFYEQY